MLRLVYFRHDADEQSFIRVLGLDFPQRWTHFPVRCPASKKNAEEGTPQLQGGEEK